ncbi:HotDog domain-containing protein [Mycena pura]|uniref:HotDog domain-containing protein n=1 Tax=Mycena pura TaxID=153505 RepID=A0AAD6VVJ0_9AGAR|nr:HotDog domain-containing protein [Mycena pura]
MSTTLLVLRRHAACRLSLQLRPRTLLARTAATSTDTPPPPPPRRGLTTLAALSLVTLTSLGAYSLGALYPPPPLTLLYPRPAPAPPADPDSPESRAYTAELEAALQALPALAALRAAPDAAAWYETRPHANVPEAVRVNRLTSGALRGPGRIAVLPLARVRRDERAAVVFVHLGRGLCGHDGIVHGGLLATLLDEALGRNAAVNLPEKVGVTATLSVKYKAPTRADQFVVMKTELVEQKGRKALVKGTVEALDGTVLVEAEALFVQPRYAKLLNTAVMRQYMGTPPPPEPVVVIEGEGKIV